MFGGTVNLKYCSALYVGDDGFDTDESVFIGAYANEKKVSADPQYKFWKSLMSVIFSRSSSYPARQIYGLLVPHLVILFIART